ncbi:hypothetical protein C8J57DRAFT_1672457 [Mycena rebaudengoi]|nr:hypothetical protein C8J57DRAFT_1672457 [Mycena rebaudengoi]
MSSLLATPFIQIMLIDPYMQAASFRFVKHFDFRSHLRLEVESRNHASLICRPKAKALKMFACVVFKFTHSFFKFAGTGMFTALVLEDLVGTWPRVQCTFAKDLDAARRRRVNDTATPRLCRVTAASARVTAASTRVTTASVRVSPRHFYRTRFCQVHIEAPAHAMFVCDHPALMDIREVFLKLYSELPDIRGKDKVPQHLPLRHSAAIVLHCRRNKNKTAFSMSWGLKKRLGCGNLRHSAATKQMQLVIPAHVEASSACTVGIGVSAELTSSRGLGPKSGLEARLAGLGLSFSLVKPRPRQAGPKPAASGQDRPRATLPAG